MPCVQVAVSRRVVIGWDVTVNAICKIGRHSRPYRPEALQPVRDALVDEHDRALELQAIAADRIRHVEIAPVPEAMCAIARGAEAGPDESALGRFHDEHDG